MSGENLPASGKKISGMDRMALGLADIVIRWKFLVIALCVLLTGIAGYGATSLKFSNNYRVFFSEDNPQLAAFESLQRVYTKSDNILFVVKPKSDVDVFNPETAAAIEKLTELAWKIPFAGRVDSISNYQHSWADGDELIVENLYSRGAELSAEELQKTKNTAMQEPLLSGSLLASDGQATGINVVMRFPEKSLTELPEAISAAHELAGKIESEFPNVEIVITGIAALNDAFSATAQADSMKLMPIMYLLLLVVMVVILRSVSGVIGTLFVIIFSTVSAMGISGYLGLTLDPICLNATIVILTLAVADSIHLLISMQNAMAKGMDKNAALKESIRSNFLAITITSVTTLVGFLTLNFSEAPPFWNLGNITSLGIAGAWFYSLVFLPAFISAVPVKVKANAAREENEQSAILTRIANFVIAKYRTVLVVSFVFTVFMVTFIPKIELEDQWVKYFDYDIPFRADAEFAMEHLTGLYLLEYSVESEGPGGISDPVYLSNLERYVDWLREQPEVLHVYSYTDVIKKLNKNMHEDDPSYYKLPDNKELAAQYLLLYELSLPYGLDLNDRINIDKSATRVTATIKELSTVNVRAFIERTESWMRDNMPSPQHAEATGTTVMFSHISKRNIESMLIGNAVAVIAIALILVITLRSLGYGLLSLVPNLAPVLVVFGLWSIIFGQAGMAAATVSATSLGIIVDATVHFLIKFLRGRRDHGYDQPEAILYAFNTVGKAIFANTVILASGFLVLATSGFKINTEMGQMTALAILVALIVDFTLLPALLMLGKKKKRVEEEQAREAWSNNQAVESN